MAVYYQDNKPECFFGFGFFYFRNNTASRSLEVHMNFVHIKTLDFNFGCVVHVLMKGKNLSHTWMNEWNTPELFDLMTEQM